MAQSCVSIQKLCFDLGSRKEKAASLQQTISRLFHDKLHGCMDEFFNKVVPGDTLLQKDSLTLHLGTISYEELEYELPRRLIKALEDEFSFLISQGAMLPFGSREAYVNLTTEERDLSILESFLLTGTVPWSAAGIFNLQTLVDRLHENNRSSLGKLLLQAGQQHAVRKRLAYQLCDESIDKIIGVIEPAESPFIISYKKRINTIQQERQLVRSDAVGFGRSVCLFVLTSLLEEKGSTFSRKMFVKSMLVQMAAHYNTSYAALLGVLHEALYAEKKLQSEKHLLSIIITSLYDEMESLQPDAENYTAQNGQQVGALHEKMRTLAYYLQHGSLPAWLPTYSREDLAAYCRELLKAVPAAFKELLLSAGDGGAVAERLVAVLEYTELQELLKLFVAHEPAFIEHYTILLQKLGATGQLTGTPVRSYHLFVWKTMFVLLLDNRKSWNSRQLIRESIQAISLSEKLPPRTFLEALINMALKESGNDRRHAGFFHELLEEYAPASSVHALPLEDPNSYEQKAVVRPAFLKDALYYFVQYGSMPWWARAHFSRSPQSMLENLYDWSPIDAVLLLKTAGKRERSKRRFLMQFSPFLIIRIISRLPGTITAAETFKVIAELVQAIPLPAATADAVKIMILEEVWNNLAERGYLAFEEGIFLRTVLRNTSRLINHSYPDLLSLLMRHLEGKENIVPVFLQSGLPVRPEEALQTGWEHSPATYRKGPVFLQRLIEAVKSHPEAGVAVNSKVYPSAEKEWTMYKNLDALIGQHAGGQESDALEERRQQVLHLLDYFLIWNRLPDTYKVTDREETDSLLEEMMILLYHENRDALKHLWKTDRHAPAARMRLHGLFTAGRGGDHKQIGKWLEDYMEADALEYLREAAHEGKETADGNLKAVLDELFQQIRKKETYETLSVISQSPALARYVSRHYDESTIQWLVEGLAAAGNATSRLGNEVKAVLLLLTKESVGKVRLRLLLNEFNLVYFSGLHLTEKKEAYIGALLDFLAGTSYGNAPDVFKNMFVQLEVSRSELSASEETLQVLKRELQQKIRRQQQKEASEKVLEEEKQKSLAAAARQRAKLEAELQQKQRSLELSQKPERREQPSKENKIYIQNAGIVLLHPFLNTYFTRLGLMEKGQFVHEEARVKAAHLLQYLAYGTTQHAEHELVLNKILCNHPLAEPLPLEITVDAAEAALSAEMLQVVIQRSGKLSNSSVDGFRVSFLHREGVLTETEENWVLRVEQRGYDVFLQYLPWAFGMIKTSWMDKPLLVEWI